MTRYRARARELDAVQWDGFAASFLKRSGAWADFIPASDLGKVKVALGCLTIDGAPRGKKGIVMPGDWVVRDANGNYWAMDPAEFADIFEPIPEVAKHG